eukprot:g23510.t1
MRCDYQNVVGKNVIIHGHGAFTMENIRTCCEYGMKHIYLVCRKRNLTCPRVVSWFINQASPPVTGAHCLNLLKVAYRLCGYDPWDMHSVSCNAARTNASFAQKTRFGIGDVYFLAAAYGLMEVVVDNIKRSAPKSWNQRHSVGTMFTYSIVSPAYREMTTHFDTYKHFIAHHCCPVDKLLTAALAEWNEYERSWREKGMVPKDAPYIPYPYTKEYIAEQHEASKEGHHDVLKLGIGKYNEECRGIVQRFTSEWRRIVERFGRWIDFDNDYKTMDRSFMESCWWVFKQLYDKGLVYRTLQVFWRQDLNLAGSVE